MNETTEHTSKSDDIPSPKATVAFPMSSAGNTKAAPIAARSVKTEVVAHPKRTVGERVVDWLVYPFINNFVVFAVSVIATYQTREGKPGHWFKDRADSTMKFLMKEGNVTKKGLSKNSAEAYMTVFFSFADGTALAPVVKLLEDRREPTAKWIDEKLGTKPADESVYKSEPKQTWKSVIEGRFLTSAIVVPTAFALNGLYVKNKAEKFENLNQTLFKNPGMAYGEKIATNPKAVKFFEKIGVKNIPTLFEIGLFEAFYTTVCTVGLYFASRMIAKNSKEHKQQIEEFRTAYGLKPTALSDAQVAGLLGNNTKAIAADGIEAQAIDSSMPSLPTKPTASVTQTTHQERLAPVQGLEVTA